MQPIRELHIRRLKMQSINESFALMENHMERCDFLEGFGGMRKGVAGLEGGKGGGGGVRLRGRGVLNPGCN